MSGKETETEMKSFQESVYHKEKRNRKEWWQADEQIQKFYELFYTWNKDRDGMLMAVGLLVVFIMVFAMIPFQELMKDVDDLRLCASMSVVFTGMAPALYLGPHVHFRENGKEYRFVRRLQYFPVDVRKLHQIHLLYLVKFMAKIFVVALVLQMIFSLMVCHGISWNNICYIGVIFFLIPLGINLLALMADARFW